MRPAKAFLFLAYAVLAVFIVGASFSRLWRLRKQSQVEGQSARALAVDSSSEHALAIFR